MSVTPRPTGSDEEALFHQETRDLTRGPSAQFRNSSTVKFQKTPGGIFAKAAPQGGVGAVSKLVLYQITKVYVADYIGAKLFNVNLNEATGPEVKIAKCLTARMIAHDDFEGNIITYNYFNAAIVGDSRIRKASCPGFTEEWQVIHPMYQETSTDDRVRLIAVAKMPQGTGVVDDRGNQIKLIEVSPQRLWAYQADQSGQL